MIYIGIFLLVSGLFAKSFYILGDRACLENLAADESHRALKSEMRNRMLNILREQKGPAGARGGFDF